MIQILGFGTEFKLPTRDTVSPQLAIPAQVGGSFRCRFFRIHFPSLFIHGRTGNLPGRIRVQRQE